MTEESIHKQIALIKEQIRNANECGKCLKKLKKELAIWEAKLDKFVS